MHEPDHPDPWSRPSPEAEVTIPVDPVDRDDAWLRGTPGMGAIALTWVCGALVLSALWLVISGSWSPLGGLLASLGFACAGWAGWFHSRGERALIAAKEEAEAVRAAVHRLRPLAQVAAPPQAAAGPGLWALGAAVGAGLLGWLGFGRIDGGVTLGICACFVVYFVAEGATYRRAASPEVMGRWRAEVAQTHGVPLAELERAAAERRLRHQVRGIDSIFRAVGLGAGARRGGVSVVNAGAHSPSAEVDWLERRAALWARESFLTPDLAPADHLRALADLEHRVPSSVFEWQVQAWLAAQADRAPDQNAPVVVELRRRLSSRPWLPEPVPRPPLIALDLFHW